MTGGKKVVVMLRKLINGLVSIPNKITKLAGWIANPQNGSDYVSPFRRHYLSTGTALLVTIIYRVGMGLYDLIVGYILGSMVYLVQFVVGVGLDLWRANPNYTRWALRSLYSAAIIIVSLAVIAAKTSSRVLYSILMIVIGFIR